MLTKRVASDSLNKIVKASLEKDEAPKKAKCGVKGKDFKKYKEENETKMKKYLKEVERTTNYEEKKKNRCRYNSLKCKLEERSAKECFKNKIERANKKF